MLNENVKQETMKNYKILDTNELTVNRFTYSEFVNHAETRKSVHSGMTSSRKTTEKTWSGTKSFKEAMEFARSGYDAGIKQLELEGGILANTGIELEANVYGSVVNMGSYLQGLPDNMFVMKETREFNMPLLTIYVNLSYHAGNSSTKAFKFTKSITDLVNSKQAKHNIRLVGMFHTRQDGNKDFVTEVLIKDFDQRFVLNNVAFAFHTSFFRRLWFSHLEGEACADTYGYGRSSDESKVIKYVKEMHDKGSAILLPNLGDLGSGHFDESSVKIIKK